MRVPVKVSVNSSWQKPRTHSCDFTCTNMQQSAESQSFMQKFQMEMSQHQTISVTPSNPKSVIRATLPEYGSSVNSY